MANQSLLKLNKESISNLMVENYDKNYTITVNDEDFKISRFFADILSPKINNFHHTDPTNDNFTIKTKNKGNFSSFLKLFSFKSINILDSEIPFILEIANILENNFIELEFQEDNTELSLASAISNLQKHEIYDIICKKQIKREIDFISTHLFELNDNEEANFGARFCTKSVFLLTIFYIYLVNCDR